MKKIKITIHLSLLIGVQILFFSCEKKEAVLNEHLWYESPSKDWFEALPLGNGRLGAMVHGDVC